MNEIERLLHNAVMAESSIQKYIEHNIAESKIELIKKVNDLLYETAQEKNISLYELCASVVPEITYEFKESNPYEGGNGFKVKFETTIKLKPINI